MTHYQLEINISMQNYYALYLKTYFSEIFCCLFLYKHLNIQTKQILPVFSGKNESGCVSEFLNISEYGRY